MDQVRRSFTLRIARFDEVHVMLVIFDGTMSISVDRIRSDFVANVSHGALTTDRSVGVYQTLQDGAIDDGESRDRFLAIMQNEAGRMRRLMICCRCRGLRRRNIARPMTRLPSWPCSMNWPLPCAMPR